MTGTINKPNQKPNTMKTNKILAIIRENGGLNCRNWTIKEIVKWVKINYDCSSYIAINVAYHLKG